MGHARAGGDVPTGAIFPFGMNTPPTGWLECDGAAVSRVTYATLFATLVKSATVTITIANPGVVSWTAHGLKANDPVKFSTTGALPTGLVAGTTYYVVATGLATDSFRVSATAGGAAIETTGTQSGVQTGIHGPHGTGDDSTTFNVPDLRGQFIRGWDNGEGTRDANRAFGIAQADALQGHKHTVANFVTSAAGSEYVNTAGNKGTVVTATDVPVTDGASGTPRTAVETRPTNLALMYCIKT